MTNETFEQLKVAYESGLTRPLAWRRAQLNALRRLVMENRDAFISSAMADLGKPAAETVLMELNLVAGEAQFVRNRLGLWTARHPKAMHWMLQPAAGWTIAEPKGVVLIISPWNYPVLLALEPMADALAAGNAVCLKPSELSPNTSKLLAELVPQYLDAEAVRVGQGDGRGEQARFLDPVATGKLAVPVQAEHTGIHGVFHDIPGGEDNGDARTGDAFDWAGPVLDDGGMPHAHALDVGDGVVFPAGESADARDVSDSHDSVPCCQLNDQWTCVT